MKLFLQSILSVACLFLLGCEEFIEPSIEDKRVVLLSPAIGTETSEYAQTFWWEEVDKALSYRLQVVSPDFEKISKLVLDTVVKSNKFKYTLEPGKYEWRVQALNGSSQTIYNKGSFTIFSTSISEQQVQLTNPSNNTITNLAAVSFQWLNLFGAKEYQIQVDTLNNNFQDQTKLFLNKNTSELNYASSFSKDQVYKWRVKAINEADSSKWSVIQSITYDKTPPAVVTLASPGNNVTVSKPVTLRWNGSAGAKKYLLYVYKSDSTTPFDGTYPITLTEVSSVFNSGTSGEQLFWEVRAVDDAGNISKLGELRGFLIQ
jgi:hypothetical protein